MSSLALVHVEINYLDKHTLGIDVMSSTLIQYGPVMKLQEHPDMGLYLCIKNNISGLVHLLVPFRSICSIFSARHAFSHLFFSCACRGKCQACM